jgi:hypothetical protein
VPIRFSFDPDSNVTDERDIQREKVSQSTTSTEEGMQIPVNDVHSRNASGPICCSFDDDSNVTDERDRHEEKQPIARSRTEAGMQIDVNDEHD